MPSHPGKRVGRKPKARPRKKVSMGRHKHKVAKAVK